MTSTMTKTLTLRTESNELNKNTKEPAHIKNESGHLY